MVSSQRSHLNHTSTGFSTPGPAVARNLVPLDRVCDDPDDDSFRYSRWYRTLILFVSFDIVSTSITIVAMAYFLYDDPLVFHTNFVELLSPNIDGLIYNVPLTDRFLNLLSFSQSWLPTNQFLSLLAFILNSLLLETMRLRGVYLSIVAALQISNIVMMAAIQQPLLWVYVDEFRVAMIFLAAVCLHPVACILYWLCVEGVSSSISSCR